MSINRFKLSLIIRISFLLVNMLLISIVIRKPLENQMIFTLISLIIILILQVIMLFEFLNHMNQNLLRFFMIIFDSDYSTHFQEKIRTSPFIELNRAFNKVIDKYKDLSRGKELYYHYLDEVVKHIKVGIISVNQSGEISIMNAPAADLLQTTKFTHWSDLEAIRPEFTEKVDRIKKNGPVILKLDLPAGIRNLTIHISRLVLDDDPYRLILFQDVQAEVEQGEVEATQKLMRILTHEIMNSITPINSLTETISMILDKEKGIHKEPAELTDENLSDIRKSVLSIRERTEGLNHFLQRYRKLSQLPKLLKPKSIKIEEFFNHIDRLMRGEFRKMNITFVKEMKDTGMEIFGDPHLLEQIIINLLRNSIDALAYTAEPIIKLVARSENDHSFIEVSDNGSGIIPKDIEQIFVPFYSTKKTGSGIGLSFSRQIMRLHDGSISVKSEPGVKTVFTLNFHKKD